MTKLQEHELALLLHLVSERLARVYATYGKESERARAVEVLLEKLQGLDTIRPEGQFKETALAMSSRDELLRVIRNLRASLKATRTAFHGSYDK